MSNAEVANVILNNLRDEDFKHTRAARYGQEWISVKERMPEKDGRYLVVEDHHTIWVGVASMRAGKFDIPIKYWQEVPEPPKEND